jgi:hypothetical protein
MYDEPFQGPQVEWEGKGNGKGDPLAISILWNTFIGTD